jgi:hypothetical protein
MIKRIRTPLFALLAMLVTCSVALADKVPGTDLTPQQRTVVVSALQLIQSRGLTADAELGQRLLKRGVWRAALPDDIYITGAEKAGDTPFAYTLSPGYKPVAIVLAARFFTETTAIGRAALMVHELGHYKAYVKSGRSDEFDGYKAEYDSRHKLGLSEKDGLVYFAMLDGTAEYVAPRDKGYAANPDLKQFLTN